MPDIKNPLPLDAEEIAILPARAKVVANLKWIRAITIVTPSPNEEGRLTIEYVPITPAGVIVDRDNDGNDLTRTVQTRSLYAHKDQLPELAVAFAAFLNCIQPLEQFTKAAEAERLAAAEAAAVADAADAITAEAIAAAFSSFPSVTTRA